MKNTFYIIESILIVMVFIYGIESSDKTGAPVSLVESNQKNEEKIASEGPTKPDYDEFALKPSLMEDILAQRQELSPQNVKTTIPFPTHGIPVLMYHSISTNQKNSLCVSEKQFKEEMEWLYNNGYHTMNINEFYEALTNQGLVPDNPVLITFDDGYADNYKTAWPILKQYGFTATFFIITKAVNPSRINWEQLKELIKAILSAAIR